MRCAQIFFRFCTLPYIVKSVSALARRVILCHFSGATGIHATLVVALVQSYFTVLAVILIVVRHRML